MISLLEEIAPDMLFLVTDYGLSIRESIYSREDFGNADIILSNGSIYIRIVRDRGVISVEVSRNGRKWHDLERVLEYLDSSFVPPRKWWSSPIDQVAAALRSNWNGVLKITSSNFKDAGYRAFEKKKQNDTLNYLQFGDSADK